jgi:hypothetical protein
MEPADESPPGIGTISIRVTTAGPSAGVVPAADGAAPPAMLPEPVPAMLPLEVVPLGLPAPAMPLLPLLPMLLLEDCGVLVDVSPLDGVELELAVSLPPMPMEPHPASPSASMPAKTTLNSLRFMINSLCWVFFSVCVTMQRATKVRGRIAHDVPVDPDAHDAHQIADGYSEFAESAVRPQRAASYCEAAGLGRKAQSRPQVIRAALQSTSQSATAPVR